MPATTALLAAVLSVAMVVPSVNTSLARAAEESCVSVAWPGSGPQPAEFGQLLRCRVASHDGVELNGWIGLPRLEAGARVPVALHSTPYITATTDVDGRRTPEDPAWWSDSPPELPLEMWGLPPIDLVRRGYAAAFFSVRGSGRSGGCFDWFGRAEQLDQVELVNWLATRQWSNGNVGMGGVSYPGSTPWEAAIHHPPALKTIVVSGIVSDAYQLWVTPQGAPSTVTSLFPPDLSANGVDPSIDPTTLAGVAPQRLCPDVARIFSAPKRVWLSADRDAAFWEERRLIDGFPRVEAAVLLAQGFYDTANGAGHAFQESAVWGLLDAPKRQIEGQWGHTFPYANAQPESEMPRFRDHPLANGWAQDEWHEVVLSWLDYWLKGEGSPPRVGMVDYQDNKGGWHQSDAWPPSNAKDQVLHLGDEKLARSSVEGSDTFRSAPYAPNMWAGASGFPDSQNHVPWTPYAALCPDSVPGSLPLAGLSFLSDPARDDVLIAGNPHVSLDIESDQPGGLITAILLDLGPGFSCNERGEPTDVRMLSLGAADLRFDRGNYVARDFPVGEASPVRIDLIDIAEVLPAGHRLAITLSYGETHVQYSSAEPFYPTIKVISGGKDGSQLVVPVVTGTLGGKKPQTEYLPRPFIPAS
jgi:putative CocE/NonD family hydrolase